jgi:hypothetical protein
VVRISSMASKWQVLKVGMPIFQSFYELKLKTSNFKFLAFYFINKPPGPNILTASVYRKVANRSTC